MGMVKKMGRGLIGWAMSRPRLDIVESSTWFLLLFVYAHILTTDGPGFQRSGVIPQVTAPHLIGMAMILLCLFMSIVVLIEPLLPSNVRQWTKNRRCSVFGRILRLAGLFFAFILGLAGGFVTLVENAPSYSWLITSVAVVGFVIFVLLGIKLCSLVGKGDKDDSEEWM